MDGGDSGGFVTMLQEYGVMLLVGMAVLVLIGLVLGLSEGGKRSKKRRFDDKGGGGEGG